jgi:alkylation response protein AidB-like acyl-CoA dehydrogenase
MSRLEPVELSDEESELAAEARSFARSHMFEPSALSPMRGGMDREFSRELGRRGFAGMQLPKAFGGHERTAVARCLVVSELLAAGAPLGAHWTADRQVGPSVLRNGSEKLRLLLLPRIAAGDCLVAGGLSEPEAGSDLAGVRTRARRTGDSWLISGRKIWTSDADKADFIEVFCRTRDLDPTHRHDGLSLIVVPMTAPGITVRPIQAMDGERHFNEVLFDAVEAHDDDFVGEEGQAWSLITAELALERAGPERFMTTYPLLESYVVYRATRTTSDHELVIVGRFAARHMACRELSLSVARLVDNGQDPVAEAAMMKDLGTILEQEVTDALWQLSSDLDLDLGDPAVRRLARFLEINRLRSPVHTIAGGTTEVIRGLIAKALPQWVDSNRAGITRRSEVADAVTAMADAALESTSDQRFGPSEPDPGSRAVWQLLRHNGFAAIGIDSSAGGSGGAEIDLLDAVRALAYAGLSTPLVDGPLTAGALLQACGLGYDWSQGTCLAVTGGDFRATTVNGVPRLRGHADNVAWLPTAEYVAIVAAGTEGPVVALIPVTATQATGREVNTAGEPVVGTLVAEGVAVDMVAPITTVDLARVRARQHVAHAVGAGASMIRCTELSVGYTRARHQFGRPLAKFQAVEQLLATMGSQAQLATLVAESAMRTYLSAGPDEALLTRSAAAMIVSLDAAGHVANAAHQAHGAIGVTIEYDLHRHTRRLWEFQRAHRGPDRWARILGERILCGRPALWEAITRTS